MSLILMYVCYLNLKFNNMIKSILSFVLFFLLIIVFSTVIYSNITDYDQKYIIEYALKDIRGNEISRIKLFRNGSKLKFTKTENKGKDNETITDMYIFKDEQKVYTVISGKKSKVGSKHVLDMSFVGMQTGVYIFDLGNDGSIFNSNSRVGNGTVLDKDCVLYNLLATADGRSDYYMYQDNLMLKRFVGTSTDGSTIEALSYDTNADVPESTFTLPSDVQFLDF
jgi:hypothetical protein